MVKKREELLHEMFIIYQNGTSKNYIFHPHTFMIRKSEITTIFVYKIIILVLFD